MPTYTFRNKETEEEFTTFMTLSEREEFLKENGHLWKQVPASPSIVSGVNLKPDDSFRDLLKTIKKNNPGSSFNTF